MSEYNISMVDISEKKSLKRIAIASGKIVLSPESISAIQQKTVKKGDPLVVGQIAALNAIKNTAHLIPLCHQIPITHIEFFHEISSEYVEVKVIVTAIAQTGVEMEALTGVSVFLLNIWDMIKYLEKTPQGQYPNTRIFDIKVIEKIKEE